LILGFSVHILAQCHLCNEEIDVASSFKCKYCDNFFCGDHRLRELHKCKNPPIRTWPHSNILECYSCHRKEPHVALYSCRHCGLRFCTQHAPQENHDCKAPRIEMSLSSPLSKAIPFLSSRTEDICFSCGRASDESLLLCPYCHHSFCSSHRWDKKRHRCMGSRESLSDLKKRGGL
jgi:predicted nucleic acid binding AN1-type Zn finger protein